MTPGLGFFYGGMARNRNALSLILLSFIGIGVVSVQWFLFGYSLTFSDTGSRFIGNFDWGGLKDVGNDPTIIAPSISSLSLCLYQVTFAIITPGLIFGSVAERTRIPPAIVFIFLWTTFVYDFVAYWTWSLNGWLGAHLHALDFAGGGPVHITSGFAGLTYAAFIGSRTHNAPHDPGSVSDVCMGTALLFFGWFGFNGGSSLNATSRGVIAAFNTLLAASSGGLTWLMLEYRKEKFMSAVAFCSGIVAGLVAITPACGFVRPWAAFIIGILASFCCDLGCRLKHKLKIDDTLDAFGIHGVGGVAGCILTGIFADKNVGALNGSVYDGGAVSGHPMQILIQLCAAVVSAAWSVSVTWIILLFITKVMRMEIRVSEEDEAKGLDRAELGEKYNNIYASARNLMSHSFARPKAKVDEKMVIKEDELELHSLENSP